LSVVDHVAARIAAGLPEDGMLLVTADHGMIAAAEHDRIDFDAEPELRYGVRMLAVKPGSATSMSKRARWTTSSTGGASFSTPEPWSSVATRRSARAGSDPASPTPVRPRIGDVVAAATGSSVVVRSKLEARLSRFIGHHGSHTAEEQLVPLLVASNMSG